MANGQDNGSWRATLVRSRDYLPLVPVSVILSVEQLHHSWSLFRHQDPKLPGRIAARPVTSSASTLHSGRRMPIDSSI